MELTQTYHNKATFPDQHQSSVKKFLAAVVRKHTQVFQSLTRGGTPFGGTIRSDDAYAGAMVTAENTALARLTHLQQQVHKLSQTISQLSDQIDTQLSAESTIQQANSAKPIGLNRFRALKTDAY